MGGQVFWAALMERNVQDHAVNALLQVALHAGQRGYSMMSLPYGRTDVARNKIVEVFLQESKNIDDALVMIDNDHRLPPDLLTRLTRFPSRECGVVGALAFRRGAPFDPCCFVRLPDGEMATPVDLKGCLRVSIVGTGAIMIRRWVFEALDQAGFKPPYFRYAYAEGNTNYPSEDVYFGLVCEESGIPHWVDCDTEIPHLIASEVDRSSWAQYMADHQDKIKMVELETDPDADKSVRPVNLTTRIG